MVSKLGEMLVKAQLITDTQLDEVMKIQRREGGKLGSIVVRSGFCSDQDIVSFLGMQYGVPAADLEQWPPIDASVIALIPKDLAQRHKVLPLQRTGNVLTLAMSDPTDIFAMDDVRFHTGYNVDPVVSSEMGLARAVEKYYGGNSAIRLADGTKARSTHSGSGPVGSGPATTDTAQPFSEEDEHFDLSELEQELDADAEFDATED
nr:type II secretion system protein GspE [Geothrix sp.]